MQRRLRNYVVHKKKAKFFSQLYLENVHFAGMVIADDLALGVPE